MLSTCSRPLISLPPARIAAHGKKLNKGKVLQVDVGETWYVMGELGSWNAVPLPTY